ncbi:S8 family serine peptidase [Saccharopolyspora shandongensis]|uniref:S8 family serine peptidase n=1 Tax=Saccharopolyspora shandongensis TaxID=418495 RepID=UPI0033F074BD
MSTGGPRVGGNAPKPEVTAPGEGIVAARAAGTSRDPIPGNDQYTKDSGTSMAAPHGSGAAAILAQAHPDWRAAQLKPALVSSATPTPGTQVYRQGAGAIDVGRALAATVSTVEGTLDLGTIHFPYDSGRPLTRTLTYRNSGTAPVTLDLSPQANSIATPAFDVEPGPPAPQGMFTVTPARLTIPAGGTATATVSVRHVTDTPALYGGWLTATRPDGSVAVATPIGAGQERPSADIDITVIDRFGRPADDAIVDVWGLGGTPRADNMFYARDGHVSARLPLNRYAAFVLVRSRKNPQDPGSTTLVPLPEFQLDEPRTMTADARRGERVQPTVDRPATVVDQDLGVGVQIDVDGKKQYRYDSLGAMLEPGARRELYIAPEPNLPADSGLLYGANMRSADGSEYHVIFDHKGPVTPGLTFHAAGKDLATVNTTYADRGPRQPGTRTDQATVDGGISLALQNPVSAPGTTTDYFSAGSGISRETSADWGRQAPADKPRTRTFQPGQSYPETWNTGS